MTELLAGALYTLIAIVVTVIGVHKTMNSSLKQHVQTLAEHRRTRRLLDQRLGYLQPQGDDLDHADEEDLIERVRNMDLLAKLQAAYDPAWKAFEDVFDAAVSRSHELQRLGANIVVHLAYGSGPQQRIMFHLDRDNIFDLVLEKTGRYIDDGPYAWVDVHDEVTRDPIHFTPVHPSPNSPSRWRDGDGDLCTSEELADRCLHQAVTALEAPSKPKIAQRMGDRLRGKAGSD